MEARIAMRIGIMSHHGQKIVPIPRIKIPKVGSVPATDAINGRPTERRVSACYQQTRQVPHTIRTHVHRLIFHSSSPGSLTSEGRCPELIAGSGGMMGDVTIPPRLGSVLPIRVSGLGHVAPSPEPLVLRLKCGSFGGGGAWLWSVSPMYEK